MVTVLSLDASNGKGRPAIDFDGINSRIDWLTIGNVFGGTFGVEDFPQSIDIYVDHPDATDWDCYSMPDCEGLFSARFVKKAGEHALRLIDLLPAKLNGQCYYFF